MSDQSKPQKGAGVRRVAVDEGDLGQRLDNFLFRELKGVPKSRIYRLIRKGEVRVSGKRARPETRLTAGDEVRIPPVRVADKTHHYTTVNIEKTIIYENNVMLIVNKPEGLAVHGGSGIGAAVIESLRAERPDERQLELVHRLDRDTSGCLMIARKRSYLRVLHQALAQKGVIRKRYVAIVRGKWPRRLVRSEAPLHKYVLPSGERMTRIADEGKRSVTSFRLLEQSGAFSLVEAEPLTGRTHQIRAHCRHAGFPIVGDSKYGDDRLDMLERPNRLMLHAASLQIPAFGDTPAVNVRAELDDKFNDWLSRAGLTYFAGEKH